MSESFLHYIWQYQYFSREKLTTVEGAEIKVFHPGIFNTHAGPDFSNAKIQLDGLNWAGHVEVHVKSSEWDAHRHQHDDAYNNVILHVVWKKDKEVVRKDGSVIPVLELKNRIDEKIIFQYKKLINSPLSIPCTPHLPAVSELMKVSALDKALVSRLENKSNEVKLLFDASQHDWQETLYQRLAQNFGFHVNAEPFLQLAKAVPFKILLKHADKLLQLEALLLGAAGFLDGSLKDDYYNLLKREYTVLAAKYSLTEQQLKKAQWKFLRLRPANFPTLRIAQLASVIGSQKNLFERLINASSTKEVQTFLGRKPSAYWQTHYSFSKRSVDSVGSLGAEAVGNIIINTVVPLLFSYGQYKDDQTLKDRAMAWLVDLPAEKNRITKGWKEAGIVGKTAYDSQALIELYNHYCQKHRCLQCAIGSAIVRPSV